MNIKKILFVCRYNRFRSRVAEVYFNKINKNKDYTATSSGLIAGFMPLDKDQVEVAREFGISIDGKPKTMNMDLLKDQEMIIIVANNVPESLFDYKWYKDKVIKWDVSDAIEGKDLVETTRESVKEIIKKVDELVKKLEKKK